MNRDSDRLLRDVFADSVTDELREQLLDETLRLAGRRRQGRRNRRLIAGAAIVVGVLWFFAGSRFMPRLRDKAYVTVTTQRLPASALVQTQPLSPNAWTHDAADIAIVHTQPSQLRLLNDQQLLAAIPNAALVRIGNRPAELIVQ